MGRSVVALFVAALGLAQPLAPETILLGRTRYHMVETLRRIPNYTCLETIERSVRAPKSRRATLVDALRLEVAVVDGKELFSWPGERQFKERDLRELAPGGAIGNGNFALHAKSVFGGNAVRFTYQGREQRQGREVARFTYDVPVQFSGYQIRVGDVTAVVPYHGQVLVDAATLDLIDLEVIADDLPPQLKLQRASDFMHYRRQPIGDTAYLLPVSSEMTMVGLDGAESRNKVTFSACRQYSGDSIVRFDDPEPSGEEPAPAPTVPRLATELPADLLIEASLDENILIEKVVTGDPLLLTVHRDARHRKTTLIPKGARLRARVAGIDRRAFRGYTMGIGIQPIEIGHEGQIVPLNAEVVEGGSVSLRTSFYALLPASPQRPAMIYVKSTPPRLLKGLLLQLRVIP
ncbi:MAG: hypothetical protein INH40_21645 [Acidobacteriaceae bacterium]|nr:hypothetical protein [Acidobacteriaceae bacterium]